MRRDLAVARPTRASVPPFPVRDPRVVRGWLLAWWGLVVFALVNGALRNLVTQPLLGETSARQIATVIMLAAVAVYQWELSRRLPIPTRRMAWALGACWSVMTVAFEVGLGRFVERLPWSTILADYDLTAGRIWVLVPITLVFLPAAVRHLQRRA